MAGHSKWSKVKRIKGPLDVKRGAQFSKLVKEIAVAARIGGGNLSGKSRLRPVVETVQVANMLKENIERAIEKGVGEIEGIYYEETLYEACALGGVAMVNEAATDNKNRTAADVRLIFSKDGGRLTVSGSVLYMFHKKGQITILRSPTNEDCILELTPDAGAEDASEESHHVVTTPADRPFAVAEAPRVGSIEADSQKYSYLPDNTVSIGDEATAAQVLRLYETLEDNDDTQNVYSNFEIPEEVLAYLPA